MLSKNAAALGGLNDRTAVSDDECRQWARVGAFPAAHRYFDRLLQRCGAKEPLTVAVAMPLSEVALRGSVDAARAGIIVPLLIGPEREIRQLGTRLELDIADLEIFAAADDADAARKCVTLCQSGRARAIMKGSLETAVLMHEVVSAEAGMRTGRRISHVFLLDVPSYPRPLLITDAAINIYPSLDEKVDIVQNAIDLAHLLGIALPNVAILSALETVHSQIKATVDAAALSKMAERGQIRGAVVDGPLAFDTAVSAEAAAIKLLNSRVAGVADILVVPDMESGNMLVKQLEYLGGAELAGVVVGARVPIILTSRSDSARARLASCAVAAIIVNSTPRPDAKKDGLD
jgi:phosphate acetyltransferase